MQELEAHHAIEDGVVVLKTRFLKFVVQPVGFVMTLAVALGVVSLAYSGLEWSRGDATAWQSMAGAGAGLALLSGNLLDASQRKTRIALLIAACSLLVVFFAGIVSNANQRSPSAHSSASSALTQH